MRGPGLDGVIVDEAAFISADAWENSLRPALADKRGWAILGSTPNGRNWFYDRYRRAIAGRQRWQAWKLPSSQNPLMTEAELQDAKDEMGPRKFAQEHEAEPIEVEGAMWPGTYFGDSIWTDYWPDTFEKSAIAVDPSLGKSDLADYSAIIFLGLTAGKMYVQASIRKRPPGDIVRDTVRMFQRLRPGAVGVESNGFQAVLGTLFDLHCERENIAPLPIHLIHNSMKKEVRIQNLDSPLSRDKFRFFSRSGGCTILVEQLMMFPLKDFNDDGPDALEMCKRLLDHMGALDSVVNDEEYVTA